VSSSLVRWDVPVMIGVSLAAGAMALDGDIGRLEGIALLGAFLVYAGLHVRAARHAPEIAPPIGGEAVRETPLRALLDAALVLAGLGALGLGARWFVGGAVALAARFGMSELVIGLTIVAAGTSLPEIATSLLASLRGQRDLAVGNVVGSNIFNLLGVLGLTAVLSPIPVSPGALGFDLPVMIAVAAACLPIFFTGFQIGRLEGGALLVYYVAYVAYLLLDSAGHEAARDLRTTLLTLAFPVTALALFVAAVLEWGRPAAKRAREH
jgi:cation:H+ antiporter